MSNEEKEQNEKLLQLVHDALQKDKELREKFQVGDKFRFIRDRLDALLSQVEEACVLDVAASGKKDEVLKEDESLVYVCLFNAQGVVLQAWQKLMHPSVFYEYSVNRPIYLDKADIESVIRAKSNKVQYGYLVMAVKKTDVLSSAETASQKENGYSLTKVKEGALHFNRLISFHHNGNVYVLNADGVLVRFHVS